MSVTILKTVGAWQPAGDRHRHVDHRMDPVTPLRGRVITGLLTVEDPDPPATTELPRRR